MEIFLLDEQPQRTWCPTCRAPSLVTREFVAVDSVTLLILERGRSLVCEDCRISVLV